MNADELKTLLKQLLKDSDSGKTVKSAGGGTDYETFQKSIDSLNKMVKQNTTSFTGLLKESMGLKKAHKDMQATLEDLDEQLEDMADAVDEETIARREHVKVVRDEMAKTIQATQVQKATVASLTAFGKGVAQSVGVLGRGFKDLASKIQHGADAFDIAGSVLHTGVDLANTGVQAAASSFGAVGNTLSQSTNPKMRMLGMASSVASSLIGGLGNAAAETAKFLIDFLVAEAKKLFDAFNKLSASGALFADGMTGMKNAAHDAGLTVKQFSEVVQRNGQALAQSGMGVTEGAKTMGRVASDLKKSGVQNQLMALGYSVEEQADLIAQTTANMRRSAGGKSSDAEIAAQTKAYAENLRTIAAITGEDAKKKVEEAAQQNQILAFQQELAKKTPAQRAQIDAAMATMTEQEKKNFRDRVVLGTVVNQEGAIYEATVKGAREKGEAALALMNNNKLTAESNAALNAQYGQTIKDSVLANQAFGKAAYVAGGQIADVAKGQLDALNQANTYTKDSVNAAKDNVKGQEQASDGMTKNLLNASQQAQAMAVKLEDIAQNQLTRFGEVVDKVISQVNNQLGIKDGTKETGGPGGGGEQSWIGKKISGVTDWLKEPGHISGALKGAGAVTETAGLAADVTGVGAVAGVPMNILGGVLTGLGYLSEAVGFAGGGISTGSPEGHLEKLHGTEAVIPLPSGDSIPVSMDMTALNDLTKKLDDLIGTMSSGSGGSSIVTSGGSKGDVIADAFNGLQDMMAKQLGVHQEMAMHAKDNKDLMQKLLNVSM